MLNKLIQFCLKNRLFIVILTAMLVFGGLAVAPFDWNLGIPRNPVSVDAIPDIGENQQIVFTKWDGRSPQDIEDQISYPLTTALMGISGVKTVRSYSMLGFSTIYVIFEDDIEFYWSRSRILEKLSALPNSLLPDGVSPSLGPDATALGQIFWYTLEGQDSDRNPTGGWDLDELRTIQDFDIKYALMSANGVSEVASVGGFVREYQIDVNPDAAFAYDISLAEIYSAVQHSNLDIGAQTMEINNVEFVIRGIGFVKTLSNLEKIVVKVRENVPILIQDIATVSFGPANRRGALDREGAEAVGGVVVVRYGENPLSTIQNVKEKIAEISPGLPKKMLSDGTASQVKIVPFYDRTTLIGETLDTLSNALIDEILITIIVVLMMVMHFRSAILIALLLPIAVLFAFLGMRWFGVDANIVALSGIAIAIGTIVDMGIVLTENILKHFDRANENDSATAIIFRASSEVSGAILTAISTTVISFLPVFTMTGAEGKLFQPLAFTKTFALVGSVLIALFILPVFARLLFQNSKVSNSQNGKIVEFFKKYAIWGVVLLVAVLLTRHWLPLGKHISIFLNLLFVGGLIGGILGGIWFFLKKYESILRWALKHKKSFLSVPAFFLVFGMLIWLGFPRLFGWIPEPILRTRPLVAMAHSFPGLGKEFMPPLDEGSFLYMPTTMPHAGVSETLDVLQKLDKAIYSVPEVESVVGKIGRAETPLDPAPLSMVETIINIIPKFAKIDGKIVRQWRDEIHSMDDIWDEIVKVAQLPGTTSAPKLQPIQTRLVMLQSGMRAPMGIKIKGPDLATIEQVGLDIELLLKNAPGVNPPTVFADRIVGKPYLEIEIDREKIARYGLHIAEVQKNIGIAIGGKTATQTVEGRKRFGVRIRYQRELRDELDDLANIRIKTPTGQQILLDEIAEIKYVRGPQMIKSEDSFLIGYVLFDKLAGFAEVDVVENAQQFLDEKIQSGELLIPDGVSFAFAGSYENQLRAEKKLLVILPISLLAILMILYFQFRRFSLVLLVFTGVFVAWSGGFILIWLYNQSWFLDFWGLRELFHIAPVNLSVAVWVGFLALFGIATDDGVLMGTILQQSFKNRKPKTHQEIREAVIFAGKRRVRPALMTTATTLLALVPILTSTGRGSDIMIPMAIPSFGGMALAVITIFVVPVLYSAIEERNFAE